VENLCCIVDRTEHKMAFPGDIITADDLKFREHRPFVTVLPTFETLLTRTSCCMPETRIRVVMVNSVSAFLECERRLVLQFLS